MTGTDVLELLDDFDAINTEFYARGWTDGLPIVPPTEHRVSIMLAGTRRNPDEVVGKVPPSWNPATVRSVAVNAVMAGCLPEYLPVVIGCLEAMLVDDFNLYAVQVTTNAVTPMTIVNGPVAKQLGINSKYNAFGQGWKSNATIGRALRLCLANIGEAWPGKGDQATVGQPGKFSFLCAENEADNPWTCLHEDAGLSRHENAATVIDVSTVVNIADWSGDAKDLLRTFASSVKLTGGNDYLSGGNPLLALSPEHAAILHKQGYTKDTIREYLFENSTIPLREFPPPTIKMIKLRRQVEFSEILIDQSQITIAPKPADIGIAVIGGPSIHSAFVLTCGVSKRVCRKFEV